MVTVASLVIFVVMLFANSPTAAPAAPAAVVESSGGIDGGPIYGQSCAGCHGGDGSGGLGPRLAGRMVERFPDPAAQAAVIADGRGGMPAFGSRLSAAEIDALVEYTRSVLG